MQKDTTHSEVRQYNIHSTRRMLTSVELRICTAVHIEVTVRSEETRSVNFAVRKHQASAIDRSPHEGIGFCILVDLKDIVAPSIQFSCILYIYPNKSGGVATNIDLHAILCPHSGQQQTMSRASAEKMNNTYM